MALFHMDQTGGRSLSKSGFILVSHDRTLLDDTTDHIMAINRNDVEIVQGNYSSWWENRNRQNAFEEAENAKIKKEISHLNDAAKRNATWADKVEKSKFGQTNSGSKIDRGFVSHKSSKMMQKAKNQERRISDALTKQEGLLKNVEESEDIKIFPLDYHSDTLIEGQKKKVMLSASLCEQAHIYIWDEPLNFIDVISRSQIEDLILKYQPTLLFVEHDEYFTKKIATREIHC